MVKLKFGDITENVVTREEFPLAKARQVLKNEVIAIIGYGVQGPAQALNLKDNGMNYPVKHFFRSMRLPEREQLSSISFQMLPSGQSGQH